MAVDRRVGGGGGRRTVKRPDLGTYHRVKSTDSIGSIARNAGTTPKLVLDANPSMGVLSTGISVRRPTNTLPTPSLGPGTSREVSVGGRGGNPFDFGIQDRTASNAPSVGGGRGQDPRLFGIDRSNQPSIGGGRGGDPRDFGIQYQSPFPLPPPLPPPDNEGGGGSSGGSSGGKGGSGGSATRPQLEPAGTPSFFRQLGQWKIATG